MADKCEECGKPAFDVEDTGVHGKTERRCSDKKCGHVQVLSGGRKDERG
jgi:hypothetical protein